MRLAEDVFLDPVLREYFRAITCFVQRSAVAQVGKRGIHLGAALSRYRQQYAISAGIHGRCGNVDQYFLVTMLHVLPPSRLPKRVNHA